MLERLLWNAQGLRQLSRHASLKPSDGLLDGPPGCQLKLFRGGPGDTSARGRFPVMRVGIDIEAVAREIFRRYDKRAIERFSTLIDQELNYAVNHEQKRK